MTSSRPRTVLDQAFKLRRGGTVLAALTALLVAGCGGSSDSSPGSAGDTTPPAVVITDDWAASVATGAVTFTFTFTEDVGTSFTASDVALTGGTKGTLTKVSSTVYRMVGTPDADTLGTLVVAIPVGAYTDLAGNSNVVIGTASQAYDTRAPIALTQMTLPVTFDVATVDYALVGFGGADDSTVGLFDPTGSATNHVARIVKSATAETWAGTTITKADQLGFAVKIPFSETNTRIAVRVWSPDSGVVVRLKAEDHANAAVTVETEATTTAAGAWETLTFDFANAAGAALNVANTYDKLSIFFGFGRSGAANGVAKTYFFDDVVFIGGGGITGPFAFATVDFDDAAVTYTLTGFGGAEASSVVLDPGGSTTNHVASVVKSATAETWAGTTVSTHSGASVGKIPFDASNTRMTVRVWSPDAGVHVRLKVEDHTNGAISCETEATTSVANGWETLTFDFANQASGTAGLNLANTYDKMSVFPNFGNSGASVGSAKTYYFDDFVFTGGGGIVVPPVAAPTTVPSVPPTPVTTTVSLYSSVTGGYNGTLYDESSRVDRWPCATWSSAQCLGPAMIDPGLGTTAAPLKFVFTGNQNLGLELPGASEIDAVGLGLTYLHLDIWTPNVTNFQVKVVDWGANGVWNGAFQVDDTEGIATLTAGSSPPLATGGWVSYDLNLATAFTDGGGLQGRRHIAQILFIVPLGGTAYIDNLYFH
jgi:hypothetical protein